MYDQELLLIEIIEPPIPVVVLDDKNSLATYSGLIERYTQKIMDSKSVIEKINRRFKTIIKDNPDVIFPEYLIGLLQNKLYTYKVEKEFESPEELEKNLHNLKRNKSYLFLIDYNYENSNKDGFYILNALLEAGFSKSKFILMTNVLPLNLEWLSTIKKAGFNGFIKKSENIKSWDFGIFLNKIVSKNGFYVEKQTLISIIDNLNVNLTPEELSFLNLLAKNLSYTQIAIANPYNEENFKNIKEEDFDDLLRNRARNLYDKYKTNIKTKLNVNSKDNKDLITAAITRNLVPAETIRYFIENHLK